MGNNPETLTTFGTGRRQSKNTTQHNTTQQRKLKRLATRSPPNLKLGVNAREGKEVPAFY